MEISSRGELEGALQTFGDEGHDFAALGREDQVFIQASGTGRDRFVVEYRDGTDQFSSTRSNLSRAEVVELFGAYLDGTDAWRTSLEWEQMDPALFSGRRRGPLKLAFRGPTGDATATIVILFGVVGSALLALGLHQLDVSRSLVGRSASASGTVVAQASRGGGRHDASYPIVEFQARDGRRWSFQNRVSSSPTTYQTGSRVAVLYDPSRPYDAVIDDDTSLWLPALWLIAFGAMFVGVALYALLRTSLSWLLRWRRAATSPLRR
jgi:hypothetical protein